jgi:CheY-like chemotaxis protein
MSEEVKARVFEPFFTTKQVGRGTGLGLATSFSIVQQAKGSIEIESTPGHGTTFLIRLPRELAPPETVDVTTSSALRPISSGVVLLAEDDPQVRRLAVRALERQGFQVLQAENGDRALELARHAEQLSCVVTDVVMPIMGGVELVRQLRSFDARVPVVVMSGYVDDASLFEEANELDVRFITKPFLPADLIASVCDAIRLPVPPPENRPSL